MQQRNIIIFTVSLFILSSAWLFRANEKITDPNAGKNWWAVSFSEPASESLDFKIDNHSDNSDFHWEVLAENKKIEENNLKIEKGKFENIQTNVEQNISGKVIIRVSNGEESKEIYKNL